MPHQFLVGRRGSHFPEVEAAAVSRHETSVASEAGRLDGIPTGGDEVLRLLPSHVPEADGSALGAPDHPVAVASQGHGAHGAFM